jgi:hypothetical protein
MAHATTKILEAWAVIVRFRLKKQNKKPPPTTKKCSVDNKKDSRPMNRI